ncbi:glycosyltransferase family 2 protein [Enterococcus durans]|uniref:glycosyltransferase family 2 protein n=1 Tax=Enterococcus durans TaxID=53345 RepID=UPI00288FC422|nr:glycosyltransferase family 2 protein [Enterococcus durans]MDT2773343.1 glycosyltransferase family 2 protein [Enterococcus durans]
MSQLHVNYLFIPLLISLFAVSGYGIWELFLALRHKRSKEHYVKEVLHSFDKMFVLVPTLNEKETIGAMIENLVEISNKLKNEIPITLVVINDASTDGTAEVLANYQGHQNLKVITRELPDAQEGKGVALNAGLDWIETLGLDENKTIVGVIDSDSTPDSLLFSNVYQAFIHSNYDLIQTGVQIVNANSFLTLMQKFEFEIINLLSQIIRNDWGSALASGNGQFMTLKMTSEIRWRGTLLDDLDFSINGLLKGYYGGFLSQTLVPQEGVLSYHKLIKQRVRWCQGGMQCFFRYTKSVFKSKMISPQLKSDIVAFMISAFFSMLIFPSSLVSIIVMIILFFHYPLSTFFIFCGILLINGLIAFTVYYSTAYVLKVDKTLDNKLSILKFAYGNLLYTWLLSPVAYIAFFRLVIGKNNWEKTSHDGSQSSKELGEVK